MATINFIRIEPTEKAVRVIVRESGYDLEKFRAVSEKYFWIPKSVCTVNTDNTVEVADWFYNKNIAVDSYSFLNSLKHE